MIILTETRFSEGTITYNSDYFSFNSARSEKSGGGISVFCKNILDCRMPEINYISSGSIKVVHIKLHALRSKNMNTIAVYSPPNHNDLSGFTSDTDDLLKSIPNLETTVIGGDMNINLLSLDNSEQNLTLK